MDILKLIGRSNTLFASDVASVENDLRDVFLTSGFLVIGGAGSIGQAVVTEIFKRIRRYFTLLMCPKIIWSSLSGVCEAR